MRTLWQRTFKLRVAINMLVCALVFGWFGSVPRETISGFLGRCGMDVSRSFVWEWLMKFVDALHPHERRHCQRVAAEELAAWMALYPERYPNRPAPVFTADEALQMMHSAVKMHRELEAEQAYVEPQENPALRRLFEAQVERAFRRYMGKI